MSEAHFFSHVRNTDLFLEMCSNNVTQPCSVARCVVICVNGGVRVVRARFYGVEICSPCSANPHYCVVELQVLIFGRIFLFYVAAAKSSRSSNIDVSRQYARAQAEGQF